MPVSERRVCRVLGQHRSTQRKPPRWADDETALTEDIIALARPYGRYGYCRVTALLRDAGWRVNLKTTPTTPKDKRANAIMPQIRALCRICTIEISRGWCVDRSATRGEHHLGRCG